MSRRTAIFALLPALLGCASTLDHWQNSVAARLVDEVAVARTSFRPDPELGWREHLFDTFAYMPHWERFDNVSTQGWFTSWTKYRERILEKAKAGGYDWESLARCIDTIGAKPDDRVALLPVAAYLATEGKDDFWVIVCKWEDVEERPWALIHIRIWVLRAGDCKKVAFETCM